MASFCKPIKNDLEYESSFNILLFDLCEKASPIFRSINATPNFITTISIIFCILAVSELRKNKMVSVFYFLCYTFLDYLDGYYARKYNMVTKWGDIFDHIRDLFVILFILYIVYTDKKTSLYLIIFSSVFIFYTLKSFGCQELYHNNACDDDEGATMNWTKPLCDNYFIDSLFNRLVGTGGFYILICILMSYKIISNQVTAQKY